MRIIIAPQEFKGTLSAREAAAAMAEGARRATADAEVELMPLSDGGPGLVEAMGGRTARTSVRDPLGRPVDAEWGLLGDGTAVVEMAAAAGLWRLKAEERDPRVTTTYGVGQLIEAALDAGARRIIVGLGGSATNDGGAGMASALGVRFLDEEGSDLPPGGAALARLARIDASGLDRRVKETLFIAASDVTNPLCGPDGASLVYRPQKGASPEVARELDEALRRYAEVILRDLGVAVATLPGAGAAGGMGAGMIAVLGAEVRAGFDVVAETVSLRQRLEGADLVLTGEGRLDRQTGYGKVVLGVARLARECDVPAIVVAGALGEGWREILSLVDWVEAVVDGEITPEAAMSQPAQMLAAATERAVRRWLVASVGR